MRRSLCLGYLGLRAGVHPSSPQLCWFYFVSWSFTRNAVKLYHRLIRQRLLSPRCFLPIEGITSSLAICPSTLPYQENINRTICSLVTSTVIPPNQIMTNWKMQGEQVTGVSIKAGRHPIRELNQTETQWQKILSDFSAGVGALRRLCVNFERF